MDDLTPRERRQQRTREAILDAARQIIREQGAEAVSIRAIAAQIDYSPAGLYEYFDSKEAIMTAVCWQGHERLTRAMTAVEATLPPGDYLVAIGQAYIAFAMQNPEHYLMMFTNPAFAGSPEEIADTGSSFGILLAAIERGLEEGVFQARAGFGLMEMAYAAWGLVHGLAMLRLTYLTEFPSDFDAADQEALLTFVSGLTPT